MLVIIRFYKTEYERRLEELNKWCKHCDHFFNEKEHGLYGCYKAEDEKCPYADTVEAIMEGDISHGW